MDDAPAARGRPRGRRGAFARSSPTAPSCTPTATGCSARRRRRGRAPGGAAARLARAARSSRGAARCARGCTRSRPTSACERSSAGPSGCCRSTTARRRPPRRPGRPLVESVWVEPYPDERLGLEDGLAGPEARYEQRESVELAFIAALQHLPARQRAVLILRDVLGFSAREVAAALEMSPRVGRQRAAARPQDRRRAAPRPQPAGDARARSATQGLRAIVDRYVDAWERADVDAVVEMLAEDGAFDDAARCPPGTAGARRWRRSSRRHRWRATSAGASWPARANGQPAFGNYRWDAARQAFVRQRPRRAHARRRGDRARSPPSSIPSCSSTLRAAGRGAARPMIERPCRGSGMYWRRPRTPMSRAEDGRSRPLPARDPGSAVSLLAPCDSPA